MRIRRLFILGIAALTSHVDITQAQTPLTARDSSALVQIAIADIGRSYRPFVDKWFVIDSARTTFDPLVKRVVAGLARTDTIPVDQTTPRARFSGFTFAGDTASVRVGVDACTFQPREWISGSSAVHRYIRRGDQWEPELRRSVAAGDGTRCPY